jgi:ribosomal protein L35
LQHLQKYVSFFAIVVHRTDEGDAKIAEFAIVPHKWRLLTYFVLYGFKITPIQSMGVKKVPKTQRTKSAAKKRFRVTASGHIKCWPSSLHGKARIIKRAGLHNSTAIHLAKLLPTSGWKPTTKSAAKSKYLLQDQEFDGI